MKAQAMMAAVFAVSAVLGTTAASAQEGQSTDSSQPYLFEAAQTNLNLASSFKKIIAPVAEQAPWLLSYGTGSPAEAEKIDNTDYLVFWGCKPHSCTSESYVVLYEPKSKEVVAGAFVHNNFADNTNLKNSEITWLGQPDWDQARLLGRYLY